MVIGGGVLKIRTIGIIKSLMHQGKTSKEINLILMKQGLIAKPISSKSLSEIRTGKVHSDVIRYDQYLDQKKIDAHNQKCKWERFLQEIKDGNLNEVMEIEPTEERFRKGKSMSFLAKYIAQYNLKDDAPECQLRQLMIKYGYWK